MSNLTQQDLTDISNIVTSNIHSNDIRMKQFSGLPKDAVQFFEEFDYYGSANNWNDDKKVLKLGTYLTGPSR